MDVVGSEIGQKMRSAIKAKLTELGCYVDDELPDYVMVMVANKRTRAQMEDDLQLFLGDNTELFVNWLHQVLKKLQEVTIAAPIKLQEPELSKEKEKNKEKKGKDKKVKDKSKKSDMKKAKKKEKEKTRSQRKKEEKKAHKKKKSKHGEMIRPNIPPLLTNIEKVSEPSITDVFAGQILKNHGILLDNPKETTQEAKPETKVLEHVEIETVKRPIVPIIDPAALSEPTEISLSISDDNSQETIKSNSAPREEQLKEINEIEAKIQGLKQKLVEQLDSMSDDEDFLNIRTEAEELMQDFAEDVFQEISQQATNTPPIHTAQSKPLTQSRSPARSISPSPIQSNRSPGPVLRSPITFPTAKEPEALPQIELKLPKRPIRERLGIRVEPNQTPVSNERENFEETKKSESPERFTPERDPPKSAKSRLGDPPPLGEPQRKRSSSDDVNHEPVPKRLTSKVSVLENRNPRVSCVSVVRVRPRPRVPAPASSLLLRAVADAHKSLLNAPQKIDCEPTVKRAFVRPMRRCEPQKILIQVAGNEADDADVQGAISLEDHDSEDSNSKMDGVADKDEYVPVSITKKFHNTDYTPSASKRSADRTSTKKDDSFVIETINIHNPTVDKDKNTKFIVTMDGYHPNAFLAKKLKTEGLLNDGEEPTTPTEPELKTTDETIEIEPTPNEPIVKVEKLLIESSIKDVGDDVSVNDPKDSLDKKRVSDTSEDSATQVIIEKPIQKLVEIEEKIVKRKNNETEQVQAKKRKSSPIVFDVKKKEDAPKPEERERQRTESAGSDNQVTVTTTTSSHKYDSLPPLSTAERTAIWCRAFPQCRYGAACAFQHPRCRFAAACTRRGCSYTHVGPAAAPAPAQPHPVIASHVVPAANYKSISATPLPAMCKYYPTCSNPGCHYYHPKPCRYGKSCANKFDCNFYHPDVPASKWRCTV